MERRIPTRPSETFGLKENEMNCLSFYVIFRCKKEYAYKCFMDTPVKISATALKHIAEQFFAGKEQNAYIEAMRAAMTDFLSQEGASTRNEEDNASDEPEIDSERNKKRKLKAAQKIIDHIIRMADKIEDMDDPESIVKIADKVGLFDSFEQAVEAPRRYLPQSCNTGCRYRLFCEENIANGNIVDECEFCKYRKFANDRGVEYPNTEMLEIPAEEQHPEEIEQEQPEKKRARKKSVNE